MKNPHLLLPRANVLVLLERELYLLSRIGYCVSKIKTIFLFLLYTIIVRPNEISEELDFCSGCKIGYLKLTREVVVKRESADGYRDIGTRRVFKCDNCKQRQVRVARRDYVIIGEVKTKFT